jgi:hypothetical protein
MKMEEKLLPLAEVEGREFLIDIENREFRDFDNSENVIKMHSPVGRELLSQMMGTDWNCMGISTGRQRDLEV